MIWNNHKNNNSVQNKIMRIPNKIDKTKIHAVHNEAG